jgi:hypothetical protein
MRASGPHYARRVLVSLAFYWVCGLGTHASGLWQPMHADYSCWLRIARDWRQGAALYRDCYDNKSPWVYRGLQVIDTSRPEISCYLVESIFAAVGATVFRVALTPSFPRTAVLAPMMLVLWSGISQTFYGAQSTEAFALWCDVAAMSCWVLATHRGSAAWAFAAGVSFFLCVALRPPVIVHVIAWLPFLWLLFRRYPRKIAWITFAAACCGWMAMLGLFLLDARSGDYGEELLIVLARNSSYGSLERVPWGASVLTSGITVTRILVENPCSVLFVVMTLTAWWHPLQRIPSPQKCWCLAAGLWWVAAIAGAFPGGRHYAHYYHLMWPAVSLVGTFWLSGGWNFAVAKRIQRKLIVGVAGGSIAAAVLQQAYLGAKEYRDYRSGQHSRILVEAAASFLEHATSPQTPVAVHVWHDWAELYWRVPRPAPSFSIPHVLPKELFGQWVYATLSQPPEFIVWDGTPWEPVDGPAKPEIVDHLTSMISGEYKEIKRFGELSIFERIPRN